MSQNRAIGGYFELELPKKSHSMYEGVLRFQSARAAFYSLLLEAKPSSVWMPRYICDSMLAPLTKAQVEVKFYSISSDFSIENAPTLNQGELLLYVNYFGICRKHQEKILEQYPAEQVIFDHSQAFFSEPLDCLATLYSPRKFFGVPDGGLLYTSLSVEEPLEIDSGSLARCEHLLTRLGESPEAGYEAYQSSEKQLEDFEPKRMSALTDRLLSHIDVKAAKSRRLANVNYLHEQLKASNLCQISNLESFAAMSYPYLIQSDRLKQKLISERVFVPTYWPEVKSRAERGSVESLFYQNLIPIPCDQRYTPDDLSHIIQIIQEEHS